MSADRDHVEEAVVELGVGRRVHAAAVGAAVGGADGVAAELVAFAVQGQGERGRLPVARAPATPRRA